MKTFWMVLAVAAAALVLTVAGEARELARWGFNEGSGTTTADLVGLQWVDADDAGRSQWHASVA